MILNMKVQFILVFFSLIYLLACNKDEPTIETFTPIILGPIDLDIDEDGVTDYVIEYKLVDIEPIDSLGGVLGREGMLKPLGANEVLRSTEGRSLFLRDLDLIEENVEEPLRWRDTFSSTLVSIKTINAEGEWPDKWQINSEEEYPSYFLGLKLVSDNEIKLAWLEIEINEDDGRIMILQIVIL